MTNLNLYGIIHTENEREDSTMKNLTFEIHGDINYVVKSFIDANLITDYTIENNKLVVTTANSALSVFSFIANLF